MKTRKRVKKYGVTGCEPILEKILAMVVEKYPGVMAIIGGTFANQIDIADKYTKKNIHIGVTGDDIWNVWAAERYKGSFGVFDKGKRFSEPDKRMFDYIEEKIKEHLLE